MSGMQQKPDFNFGLEAVLSAGHLGSMVNASGSIRGCMKMGYTPAMFDDTGGYTKKHRKVCGWENDVPNQWVETFPVWEANILTISLLERCEEQLNWLFLGAGAVQFLGRVSSHRFHHHLTN